MVTIGQIRKAAREHKYIGLREGNGYLMAVNSKVVFMGNLKKYHSNVKIGCIGIKPLSLNEYISIKHPFIIK